MDEVSRRTHASEPNVNQDRPLSWHPTSYEHPIDFSQYPQVNSFPQFDFSASPYNTAEINGLITPMSAPVPNEPQIQDYMAPLDQYSPLTYSNLPFSNEDMSKAGTYYLPGQTNYVENLAYASDEDSYGYQYPMPQTYQMQPTNQRQLNFDTAPPSPALLPIQNFDNDGSASPFALGSPRVEKEELVGMGLYDRPQDVQASTLFSGGPTTMAALTAGIGKGLKLEESFEPPPTTEEDEEDEEDAEQQDEPEDLTASTNTTIPPHIYVDDQSQSNYAGQTFFIDDSEGQYQKPPAGEFSNSYYQTAEWGPANNQLQGWI